MCSGAVEVVTKLFKNPLRVQQVATAASSVYRAVKERQTSTELDLKIYIGGLWYSIAVWVGCESAITVDIIQVWIQSRLASELN